MSFHIFWFNGPPSVGKDTLALYAQGLVPESRHVKIVSRLKAAVADLFNYPIELMEKAKDDPLQAKFGRTIREHQIALGGIVKTIYGENIFGELLADRISTMPKQTPYVVVSDLRTTGDIMPAVVAFGGERNSIVRLHQQGREWEANDQGYGYVDIPGVKAYDIQNPFGDREFAKVLIKGLIKKHRPEAFEGDDL